LKKEGVKSEESQKGLTRVQEERRRKPERLYVTYGEEEIRA